MFQEIFLLKKQGHVFDTKLNGKGSIDVADPLTYALQCSKVIRAIDAKISLKLQLNHVFLKITSKFLNLSRIKVAS